MNRRDLRDLIRRMWYEELRWFQLKTTGSYDPDIGKSWNKYDGGSESSTGVVYKTNCWDKMAKFCLDNQLDPGVLIKALFHPHEPGHQPFPNQGYGEFALAKYKNYCSADAVATRERGCRASFDSEKHQCAIFVSSQKKCGCSEELAWRKALAAPNLDLSHLFRYCVAVNQGWDDFADRHRLNALFEYRRQPEVYDKIWGPWIPEDFKENVKRDWICD